ncbi:hypothetical protein [Embleya scabrispora]|uniref:hypothetical protein n=1 Tax=Embleya scabrispora TaxID=159449 RepID=UPI00131A2A50|nr:hypothetical protein [Embleya scabrispora]MYS86638.1 hypothetical protein [Streptomyces sp. SID5474]
MTDPDHEAPTLDPIARTERAVEDVAHSAVDSGITFEVTDVVDAAEPALPGGLPAPTMVTRAGGT